MEIGPKHFSAIKGLLRLLSSLTPSVSFSSFFFSEREREKHNIRYRESNNGGVSEMVQCRLIAGNNAAFYKREGLQGERPDCTVKVCFKSYHLFLSLPALSKFFNMVKLDIYLLCENAVF